MGAAVASSTVRVALRLQLSMARTFCPQRLSDIRIPFKTRTNIHFLDDITRNPKLVTRNSQPNFTRL
ncbi:hypothetical protein BH09BAC1_BH09BAC1_12970 [soil metagenome]